MFVLNCDINIGNFNFKTVSGLNVRRSIHSIGATASIKLPLSARVKNKEGLSNTIDTNKIFKTGDKVDIRLGYDKLYTEFSGYVKKISYQKECIVDCEDFSYKLRENNIKKSWTSVSLGDAMNYIKTQVPGLKISQVPSMTINKVILDGKSALWFLNEIKNKYGISCFFDLSNTLQVGLVYQYQQGEVDYNIGYNCPDETDLQYVDENDVKLKIKAVGIRTDGTKIEKETGESDGELRTLYFYDVSDTATLATLAKNELEKYKFSGYRGKLTGLLDPFAAPGMRANIKDSVYGRETGSYYVESVETSVSENGGRRIVELGLKLN